MPCPKCGGHNRVEIGVGYWECTSQCESEYEYFDYVDQSRPHLGMRPAYRSQIYACGNEYEDFPVGVDRRKLRQCHCGLFGLYECTICDSSLCRRHLVKTHDATLCNQHAIQLTHLAEERRAAQVAHQKDMEAQERAAKSEADVLFSESRSFANQREDELYFKRLGHQASAEDLVLRIKQLVAAVISLDAPPSVSYKLRGSSSRWRRAIVPVVEDPIEIGTLVSSEWHGVPHDYIPFLREEYISFTTYNQIWPALAWHTDWHVDSEDKRRPQTASLWFNTHGILRGGMTDYTLFGTLSPKVIGAFRDEGSSPQVYRNYVYPSKGSIGPISVENLCVDDILPIMAQARNRPRLATGAVSMILSGTREYGGTFGGYGDGVVEI